MEPDKSITISSDHWSFMAMSLHVNAQFSNFAPIFWGAVHTFFFFLILSLYIQTYFNMELIPV